MQTDVALALLQVNAERRTGVELIAVAVVGVGVLVLPAQGGEVLGLDSQVDGSVEGELNEVVGCSPLAESACLQVQVSILFAEDNGGPIFALINFDDSLALRHEGEVLLPPDVHVFIFREVVEVTDEQEINQIGLRSRGGEANCKGELAVQKKNVFLESQQEDRSHQFNIHIRVRSVERSIDPQGVF